MVTGDSGGGGEIVGLGSGQLLENKTNADKTKQLKLSSNVGSKPMSNKPKTEEEGWNSRMAHQGQIENVQ